MVIVFRRNFKTRSGALITTLRRRVVALLSTSYSRGKRQRRWVLRLGNVEISIVDVVVIVGMISGVSVRNKGVPTIVDRGYSEVRDRS